MKRPKVKYEQFIQWVIKEYGQDVCLNGEVTTEGVTFDDLRTALAEWLKLKGEDA